MNTRNKHEYRTPPSALRAMVRRNLAMIAFLLACLLAMAIVAHADKPLPVSKVTDATPYATPREAAEAGLYRAINKSKEYEYGGVVIECPVDDNYWSERVRSMTLSEMRVAYYHTAPVTSESRVRVEYQVAYPPVCKIVATYHTHPGNTTDSMMLSREDMAQARKMRVTSFVMVVRTRAIIEYTPWHVNQR